MTKMASALRNRNGWREWNSLNTSSIRKVPKHYFMVFGNISEVQFITSH